MSAVTEPTGEFIRRRQVSGTTLATMRTVLDYAEAGVQVLDEPAAAGGGGSGPTPLQSVLGALCGCEAVTFRRTATEFDFTYERVDFEAACTIDIRGRSGDRSVRPHFQTVKMQATVTTEESQARLDELVEEVHARCPVMNLMKDAGVRLDIRWVAVTP
ncbi:MAG: OsmC family protein [Candidatus Nanopelagicales bacterium]|nr:OsmC family protein [Candidatus Nanopelagicales bacterium]